MSMKYMIKHLYILLFVFLTIHLSCCIRETENDHTSPNNGSATYNLIWPNENSDNKISQANEIPSINCAEKGISTVKVDVYESLSGRYLTGDQFLCSEGKGTVYGIPAGSNRQFVVSVLDSGGNIIYQGASDDNITIVEGKVINVGYIAVSRLNPNQLPVAHIITPTGGDFKLWEEITFEGSGEDTEDHQIFGSSLKWYSDIDGFIDHGSRITTDNLSVGLHWITLEVTDSNGGVGTDTAKIAVGEMWVTFLDGDYYSRASSVITTFDGNYIIAGFKDRSNADTDGNAWLIKFEKDGREIWEHTYGENSGYYARSAQETSDGGYIIVGSKPQTSGSAFYTDAWLIRTYGDGKEIWEHTYGGDYMDEASSVQETSDGGYILAGSTSSYGAENDDAWLIKVDENGEEIWKYTYGGDYVDGAISVQETDDGGYIVLGSTFSYGSGDSDAWLIKVDEKGKEIWKKIYGGVDTDGGTSFQKTSDGGYIIAGYTCSYSTELQDAWLIKTDMDGNKLWDKTYNRGLEDRINSVQETSDRGYILGGSTDLYDGTGKKAWLFKTDKDGNLIWDIDYGDSTESISSVQETSDGGYILTGNLTNDRFAMVIKTGKRGRFVLH